jgi:predicted GH43/DUF377 family glycosyl hydrolase
MAPDIAITHLPILLRADPTRVVLRPFTPADAPDPAGETRAQALANRVLALSPGDLDDAVARIIARLTDRHRGIEDALLRRYGDVSGTIIARERLNRTQQLLIGAYFSEEYSFEAAALFNPSIVAHPDQHDVAPGALRFVLSLRGVGEGHISSITFRTGTIAADDAITLDPVSAQVISPRIEALPGGVADDVAVSLSCEQSRDMSEIVIFPITSHQSNGIEDLRMVRFVEDDGTACYLGTYTAFGGADVREELFRTDDFSTFSLSPLRGSAAPDKGMALFPRRIDGHYVALARIDHVNIALLKSDDLYEWDGGTRFLIPQCMWEFVQLGNCGVPIEIDEGWLVLFHGVGPVRSYAIGACLLDKADPTRVLRRLALPLLHPSDQERDGYVPNVVYSCGALVNGRTLILPYSVADSFTTFATLPLDSLLAAMDPAT